MGLAEAIVVGALSLLATAALGCASQRFRDAEAGYSVVIPNDWAFQPSKSSSSVRLGAQSPPVCSGPHRAHVAISLEWFTTPQDLETFTQKNFTIVMAQLSDVRVLESRPDHLDGMDAERVVYAYDDGAGGLTLLTYFLVTDRRGFVMSCGGASDAFDCAQPICERVLRSFALAEQEAKH